MTDSDEESNLLDEESDVYADTTAIELPENTETAPVHAGVSVEEGASRGVSHLRSEAGRSGPEAGNDPEVGFGGPEAGPSFLFVSLPSGMGAREDVHAALHPVTLSLFHSFSLAPSVSLCQSLFVPVSVSLSLCLSVSLSFSLCLSVSVTLSMPQVHLRVLALPSVYLGKAICRARAPFHPKRGRTCTIKRNQSVKLRARPVSPDQWDRIG